MTDEELRAQYGHMTDLELMHELVKYKTLYVNKKAECAGKEEYCKVLNDERRPVALENQRLKRELHDANVHIANLKKRSTGE